MRYLIEPMQAVDLEQVVRLERQCGLSSRGLEKYQSSLAALAAPAARPTPASASSEPLGEPSGSREVLLVAISADHEPDGKRWGRREHEREVVGLLSGTVVIDELQIDNLAVAEDRRRQGLASSLLREGLIDAHQKGALSVVLELRSANLAALAVYTRQGLSIVGRRPAYYHDPPDDALIMSGSIERLITNRAP